MNLASRLSVAALVIAMYFVSTKISYDEGKTHYQQYEKQDMSINDAGHQLLPDWGAHHRAKDMLLLVFLAPLGLAALLGDWKVVSAIVPAFIGHFLVLSLLRSITSIATVMPKSRQCQVPPKMSPYYYAVGHCYDKMFSGHFSFGLLLTLLYFKYGLLSSSSPLSVAGWS